MRLHTANRHKARRLRRQVYEAGRAFHILRVQRAAVTGRWDKILNSGFRRRLQARLKRDG